MILKQKKNFKFLIEVSSKTGLPTGRRKSNSPEDPDYISPKLDPFDFPERDCFTFESKEIAEGFLIVEVTWAGETELFLKFSKTKKAFFTPTERDAIFKFYFFEPTSFRVKVDGSIVFTQTSPVSEAIFPFYSLQNNKMEVEKI